MKNNNKIDLQMFASSYESKGLTETKTKELLDQVQERPKEERIEYLLARLIIAIADNTETISSLAKANFFRG